VGRSRVDRIHTFNIGGRSQTPLLDAGGPNVIADEGARRAYGDPPNRRNVVGNAGLLQDDTEWRRGVH
jgi:hypothetical protein